MLRLALLALVVTGCGGYANQSSAFRKQMTQGRPDVALAKVNEAMGVDSAKSLPETGSADAPLLLLERGTILQAQGRYKLSARDLQVADKKLDVLDLTGDTGGKIAKYLFSDDATIYKAPPYEKLLLNTVNMVNYLALGDANGAKIEARRFVVNKKYLEGLDAKGRNMLALGSYLSGFAFEVAGDPGAALKHYGDVFDAGGAPTLTEAVGRLVARTGESDLRVEKALPEVPELDPDDDQLAEVLILVQTGMAPYKINKRLPIGAAVVAASGPGHGHGHRLSSKQRRRANVFAAKGLLKFVNYPKLVRVRLPRRSVEVTIDGQPIRTGLVLDVERRALEHFKTIEGTILASAITRLLTRAVAGEASQAIANKASKSGGIGLLIGLLVEGGLTAADTPDTRSWVTLPAYFYLARARVKAGSRTIRVHLGGSSHTAHVDLEPGDWSFINFSADR